MCNKTTLEIPGKQGSGGGRGLVDGGLVRRGADRVTLRVIVLWETRWHPIRADSYRSLDCLLVVALSELVVLRVGRRVRGRERIE